MLVTMGYIEDILARAIGARLIDSNSKILSDFGKRALGSLTAKLNLALLVGVIDEQEYEIIERMAKIRNLFAHGAMIDDSDANVRNHIRELSSVDAPSDASGK